MLKYGLLDDEGEVVRWVWEHPGAWYRFIVVKVKRPRRPRIDFSQFEPAPF